MSRSGQSASARTWASCGSTRSRGDVRGGTGLPETMSAMGMRTGSRGAVPSGWTTQKPSPQDRHVPSTSVMRRTALRARLAGQDPTDHDPHADDMRTQAVGYRLDGTPGY